MTTLILFLAAFAGGALNSLAGGGTLITFPALLFAGLNPIDANASSVVALFPG
ncbi:MAG: sulfite exporter TauE/SafE family protein, partial [Xanthobacteraceae bacterium]